MTRMSGSSRRRTRPATAPSTVPTSSADSTTVNAAFRSRCAARNTSEKRSRPKSSVPNQCAALGGVSRAENFTSLTADVGISNGATRPARKIEAKSSAPSVASLLCKIRRSIRQYLTRGSTTA